MGEKRPFPLQNLHFFFPSLLYFNKIHYLCTNYLILPMPSQFNTLCQETALYEAWSIVKSKGSAGGIDGVTIQEFENERLTIAVE